MSGSLAIANTFATAVGNQPGANLDADLAGIANYVNLRELTVGLLANRPAAGFNGRSYFATDVSGGTLYLDDGSTWRLASPNPSVPARLNADTTTASSVAETDLFTFSVVANTLSTNKRLRMSLQGRWFNNTGAPVNFTTRFYFGGTVFLTGTVAQVASATAFGISIVYEVQNLGATNVNRYDAQLSIYTYAAAPVTLNASPAFLIGGTTGAIDTTANQIIKITGQMGTSDANAQMIFGWGILELL